GRVRGGAGRGGAPAMSWRRLRTLLLREVRATLRDPFTLAVLVLVPLGSLLAFGFVLATDVKHLALGVLDASASPASRRLVADLAASGTFEVHPVRTRDDIARERVGGAVRLAPLVPPDHARARDKAAAGG